MEKIGMELSAFLSLWHSGCLVSSIIGVNVNFLVRYNQTIAFHIYVKEIQLLVVIQK